MYRGLDIELSRSRDVINHVTIRLLSCDILLAIQLH